MLKSFGMSSSGAGISKEKSLDDKKIVFRVSEDRSFTIHVSDPIEDIFRYDEVEIQYKGPEGKIRVFNNDFLICALWALDGLEDLLAGKLKLHPSIKQDIGCVWNEYLHSIEDESGFEFEPDGDGRPRWVGQKFLAWGASRSTSTWIYEQDNRFFIEIAPTYKWHFSDPTPEEQDEYVSHETFIKNYKPLAIIELDKYTAQEWLDQAKSLLKLVKSNDKKYFCTKPICLKCVKEACQAWVKSIL
jgi:hypothetical protein